VGTANPGFEAFYESNFGRVFSVARALAGQDEAFDIAQEAFVRTWQHWDRISRYDEPSAFTHRVVCNLARNRARGIARLRSAIVRISFVGPQGSFGDPDLRIDAAAALLSLPLRQRQVVTLCDFAGYSSKQAGRILAIRPSTVRVHLARAHATLADDPMISRPDEAVGVRANDSSRDRGRSEP
jgi:RNA polymerase sigma-70 factor, ECF subfamily